MATPIYSSGGMTRFRRDDGTEFDMPTEFGPGMAPIREPVPPVPPVSPSVPEPAPSPELAAALTAMPPISPTEQPAQAPATLPGIGPVGMPEPQAPQPQAPRQPPPIREFTPAEAKSFDRFQEETRLAESLNSPDPIVRFEAIGKLKQRAGEQAARAEQNRAVSEAATNLDFAERQRSELEDVAKRTEQINKDALAKREEFMARQKEIQKEAEAKPGSYMDRHTGEGVGLVLSAAIDGFLHPGGQNGSLQTINRLVDADVADQVRTYERKRQGLTDEITLYEKQLAETKDSLQAEAATKAALTMAAFKKAMAKTNIDSLSAEQKANLDQLQLQLEEQTQKTLLDVGAQQQAQEIQRGQFRLAQRGMRLQENEFEYRKKRDEDMLNAQIAAAQSKSEADLAQKVKELAVPGLRDADGKPIVYPTVEEAKAGRAMMGDVQGMVKNIDRMIQLRESLGTKAFVPGLGSWDERAKQLRSLHGAVMTQLKGKAFLDLGVLAGADLDLIQLQTGSDPTKINNPTPRWLEMRNNIVGNTEEKIKATSGQALDLNSQVGTPTVEGFQAGGLPGVAGDVTKQAPAGLPPLAATPVEEPRQTRLMREIKGWGK